MVRRPFSRHHYGEVVQLVEDLLKLERTLGRALYNFNSGEGPSLISKTLLLNFISTLFHGRKRPRPLYPSEKN